MKNFAVRLLASVAGIAVFFGLVHTVLVAAHLSEPAATTVRGATVGRVWASTAMLLALAGTIVGGIARLRPASRLNSTVARGGAMVAGAFAAINGGFVLATASGGPGTGNGVVGGAIAVVLGLIAVVLGWWAGARARISGRASEPERRPAV